MVTRRTTNLAAHISLTVGDPDAAFESADVVIEHTYSVPMCHQGYPTPCVRGTQMREAA